MWKVGSSVSMASLFKISRRFLICIPNVSPCISFYKIEEIVLLVGELDNGVKIQKFGFEIIAFLMQHKLLVSQQVCIDFLAIKWAGYAGNNW